VVRQVEIDADKEKAEARYQEPAETNAGRRRDGKEDGRSVAKKRGAEDEKAEVRIKRRRRRWWVAERKRAPRRNSGQPGSKRRRRRKQVAM
jgi:hypothetical protein